MRRKVIWICSLPVVLAAIVAIVGSQFDLIGQSQSIFVRSAAGTYEVVATEKNAPLPNASCGPGLQCGSRQFTMNATFMDGGQVMADATDFSGELVCGDQDFGTASSTSHGVWRYNVKKGAVEFVMIRRLSIQGGKLKVTGSGSLDPHNQDNVLGTAMLEFSKPNAEGGPRVTCDLEFDFVATNLLSELDGAFDSSD